MSLYSIAPFYLFPDINRLRQTLTEAVQVVTVRRSGILDGALKNYRNLDLSLRLQVKFTSELGADLVGLTKDLLACFWAAALDQYFCVENSKVSAKVIRPGTSFLCWPLMNAGVLFYRCAPRRMWKKSNLLRTTSSTYQRVSVIYSKIVCSQQD